MQILILNGSPKGDESVTMHFIEFVSREFPDHRFERVNAAHLAGIFSRDDKQFSAVMQQVKRADLIIWAFPLYHMLVSGQYKRFIELLFEKKCESFFKGKYCASFSTSIHFFDHTAHSYIHAVSEDLGMKYAGFFSCDMDDLLRKDSRDSMILFFKGLFRSVSLKHSFPRLYPPVRRSAAQYRPGKIRKVDAGDRKITVVADIRDRKSNISLMSEYLAASAGGKVDFINLRTIDIDGCLGCVRCGLDNICVYEDRDDFIDIYRTKIMTADILVFAGEIHDRYLSSLWKTWFDRSFFKTHQPSLAGKQIAFLVSGPLSQNRNLMEILQAEAECEGANFAGFVTDESGVSSETDAQIVSCLERLVQMSADSFVMPKTFLGVGGAKIFRDDIWGRLRFVFQGDHRYYETHGLYDFPQKQWKSRLINTFLIPLTRIPPVRKKFRQMIKSAMLIPYKKLLEREYPRKIGKN